MVKRLMIVVALVGLVLLVACGKKDDVESDVPVDDEQTNELTKEDASETNDQVNKDSEKSKDTSQSEEASNSSADDSTETDDKDNPVKQENKNKETEITMTGSYNGQADPHTIEVETDEGPVAYQLTMEARDMVVDLKPGDKVTYTYYEDGEMLVIKHIEITD